jgi:putative ABC transport system permease protein
MDFLLRMWATLLIALRRLLAQRWLALATALGLIASVALIMSIPLYSDAVYYRILQEELGSVNAGSTLSRPPFSFMWRYSGSIRGLKQLEEVQAVDEYLSGPAIGQFGIPNRTFTKFLKTDTFRLFPDAGGNTAAYSSAREPLEWVSFSSATGIEEQVNYVEGGAPAPASADPADPVEVAVSKVMADELGIQAGELYMTFRQEKTDAGTRTVQIPIRIAGIWEPKDRQSEYWFYPSNAFDTQLFVGPGTFEGRIASLLNDEVDTILWYWLMDGSDVTASNADRLVARIDQVRQRAATLLLHTSLDISPYDALRNYQVASRLLNILLYAFSIPIIGLILTFIGLVVGLSVGRQRNEIAVLRSRGATATQIVLIAILEALILAGLALAIGAPVSAYVAQMIGATKSFLNFTLESDLRIKITSTALQFGMIALGVTLVAQILPSLGASRHTIVSYKQELARTIRPPWWQRAWLDVLLMIPAIYGVYLLQQQGSILMPGAGATGDVFDNPLLFLLPAFVAFSISLLLLRLLPMIMALLAWIAARTSSVGFLLAARYLSRDPGFYTTPLVLLMLTQGLAVFTASLAQTLDNHLYDRNYYAVGADARLVELAASGDFASAFGGGGMGGGQATEEPTGEETIEEPQWVFIPVSEHLKAKDVVAAARVGDFSSAVQVQGKWQPSNLIGIDRIDFPKVAFWRPDFARASLGALMNALAVAQDGLLVDREFMRQRGLRVGDQIQVRINAAGSSYETPMKIVGDFRYFPTWYRDPEEEEKPLFVGNLDYIFEQSGGEQPYDVWVKTVPSADFERMVSELSDVEITVMYYDAAPVRIATEQLRPERQGLFGVLSVGFLASALLTVLGFLLYALFSFRRRFIELGTLRAIGLSTGQLGVFLICELAFLILLGLGTGTAIGILISQLFIPYLQIGAGPAASTPPFTVDIAWFAVTRLYVLFGVLFLVAFIVLIVLLMRMKVFQAIKLGETV